MKFFFIACLLIAGFGLHWTLYPIAAAVALVTSR